MGQGYKGRDKSWHVQSVDESKDPTLFGPGLPTERILDCANARTPMEERGGGFGIRTGD